MKFNLSGGKYVVIQNYKPLNDIFNLEIIDLIIKYFENRYQSVNELLKEFPTDFDNGLMGYFDRVTQLDLQDDVFNSLTPIFNSYIHIGLLDEAQKLWERILFTVHEWEETRKSRIHKGSIYYFWARPVILKENYDLAFFLIHQALEEDKKTYQVERPKTPAYYTTILNCREKQFLLGFVLKLRSLLENYIFSYRLENNKHFSFDIFFNKFLSSYSPIDVVFFFTYTLARLLSLQNTPDYCRKSVFAGLFELNLINDLCLVIDSLIHTKNPDEWKYIKHANYLIERSNINTDTNKNHDHLSEINDRKENNPNLVIEELLEKKMIISKDGYKPKDLECDIYLSYCLRNFSAHNLDSIPIVWQRIYEIQVSIFNVLFFTIETLY